MSFTSPESNLSRAARYAVPFALVMIPIWRTKVNAEVPQPYLDEVFHVPQAQAYWAHNWTHWDPKITTPPGLYLWSYILCAGLLALRGSPTQLDTEALRTTNVAASAVFLPWRLQTLLDTIHQVRNNRPLGAWLSHTVLNICLFPPLFFFSSLYYTDILALLVVVEAYNWDLKRSAEKGYAVLQTLVFVLVGLAALVCRQTNIFWVSVFLGGLQVVRRIRQTSETCKESGWSGVVARSLQNEVYDPLVSEASLADYIKTAVSFAAASRKQPFSLVASIIPQLAILGAFGAFVVWNNGVVLGHKEFHTAGLHLAQMLYIWPYFAFFSWPIFLLPVINLLLPSAYIPKYLDYGFPEKHKSLPGVVAVVLVIPAMLTVVHFNTIVHPFTLADNRHYVFYVFRLLLNYHPGVKYAAVVVYFLCAWAVLSAFGFSIIQAPPKLIQVPQASKPTETKDTKRSLRGTRTTKKIRRVPPDTISPETLAKVQQHLLQRRNEQAGAPHVSFVLVWLAATALSLVTAPLVEPRYLIIPWVLWRLHLPPTPTLALARQRQPLEEGGMARVDLATNAPRFLETLWFIFINAVTGYVFLYKGFEWPQEPGKIQRFMW